ncbi:MAG: hypothetical protein LCH62_15175, partial [Proteobacteria bacterium]|nr:hypothetical protein [Pseudomonadota bacterium]
MASEYRFVLFSWRDVREALVTYDRKRGQATPTVPPVKFRVNRDALDCELTFGKDRPKRYLYDKASIIAALLGGPQALVLDEPFSGLDPMAVDAMVGLLRERTREGAPVLFSSHQLDLVERLCDRLVVLAHGRVAARGTVAELRGAGSS